jgi:hypothetical protein
VYRYSSTGSACKTEERCAFAIAMGCCKYYINNISHRYGRFLISKNQNDYVYVCLKDIYIVIYIMPLRHVDLACSAPLILEDSFPFMEWVSGGGSGVGLGSVSGVLLPSDLITFVKDLEDGT